MPTITTNQIELYYEIIEPVNPTPRNRTPLLLIAGLGLNSLSWRKILPALSANRQVIIFDNRGSGRSTKPDQPYSIAMLADDAAGLLLALGVKRAHVFGFSLGSLIAQEMALKYTWLVKSLVLGASTAGSFSHILSPGVVYQTMVSRGFVEPAQAAKMIIPIIYSPEFIRNQPEQIAADTANRLIYPTPPFAYRRQLMAAFSHDTYARLDQLPMPTLLITGDKDVLVVPQNSRRLLGRIPYARLVTLQGAAHHFISEQPVLTAQLITTFLDTASKQVLRRPIAFV